MLAEGKNYAEIAEMLLLSQKSIADYTIHIKQKLRTHSLADLIRLMITTGVAKQNVLSPLVGMVTE
jgi:DNA-binding NarL/FixJ family response regulator